MTLSKPEECDAQRQKGNEENILMLSKLCMKVKDFEVKENNQNQEGHLSR